MDVIIVWLNKKMFPFFKIQIATTLILLFMMNMWISYLYMIYVMIDLV